MGRIVEESENVVHHLHTDRPGLAEEEMGANWHTRKLPAKSGNRPKNGRKAYAPFALWMASLLVALFGGRPTSALAAPLSWLEHSEVSGGICGYEICSSYQIIPRGAGSYLGGALSLNFDMRTRALSPEAGIIVGWGNLIMGVSSQFRSSRVATVQILPTATFGLLLPVSPQASIVAGVQAKLGFLSNSCNYGAHTAEAWGYWRDRLGECTWIYPVLNARYKF